MELPWTPPGMEDAPTLLGARAYVVLGLPRAGKSALRQLYLPELQPRWTAVDTGSALERMVAYKGGAGFEEVHPQASYLAKSMVLGEAIAQGLNLWVEMTGHRTRHVQHLVERLHDAQYGVHVVLADVPPEVSVARVRRRYDESQAAHGRGPPASERYIVDVLGDGPVRTYQRLCGHATVASLARYDLASDPGLAPPVLHEATGSPRPPPDVQAIPIPDLPRQPNPPPSDAPRHERWSWLDAVDAYHTQLGLRWGIERLKDSAQEIAPPISPLGHVRGDD